MHRHPVGPAFVLAAALALVGAFAVGFSRQAAVAQDATSTATAGPPLVGAWQWSSLPAGEASLPEPPTFAIFHADGTYAEWNPVAGAAIGIWRMTGERTADLVFVFQDIDPSLEGYAPGTLTFTVEVVLDETGDALTATGTIVARDEGGVQLGTMEWSRAAVRMTFETNPATGSIPATPVPATPSA